VFCYIFRAILTRVLTCNLLKPKNKFITGGLVTNPIWLAKFKKDIISAILVGQSFLFDTTLGNDLYLYFHYLIIPKDSNPKIMKTYKYMVSYNAGRLHFG